MCKLYFKSFTLKRKPPNTFKIPFKPNSQHSLWDFIQIHWSTLPYQLTATCRSFVLSKARLLFAIPVPDKPAGWPPRTREIHSPHSDLVSRASKPQKPYKYLNLLSWCILLFVWFKNTLCKNLLFKLTAILTYGRIKRRMIKINHDSYAICAMTSGISKDGL